MYDTNYIIKQDEEGKLKIYVAELIDGKIIGMIGLQRNLPEDTSCSIVSITTLKVYRNYRMFWHFARYIYSKIRKMPDVSAIYCRISRHNAEVDGASRFESLRLCSVIGNS